MKEKIRRPGWGCRAPPPPRNLQTHDAHAYVTYQHSALHLVTFDLQLDSAPQAQLDCLAHRLPDALYNRRGEQRHKTATLHSHQPLQVSIQDSEGEELGRDRLRLHDTRLPRPLPRTPRGRWTRLLSIVMKTDRERETDPADISSQLPIKSNPRTTDC